MTFENIVAKREIAAVLFEKVNKELILNRIENIVTKREIAHYEHYLSPLATMI